MLTPRPRQLKAIEDSRAVLRSGKRAIIVCAATGFGKTGVAAGIIGSALAKGRRVLFLADRRALITQAQARLAEFGVSSGIIMAGYPESPQEAVQLATVQTFAARVVEFKPDIIIIDEAHRSNGDSFTAIVARYPGAILIGLTATPVGASGRGLGKDCGGLFEYIVPTASIRELIDDGTLCDYEYFLPDLFDASGIGIKDGEYDQEEIQRRLDERPGYIGDFAQFWLKNCRGRPTLVFAPSIKEAGRICDAANAAGIRAATIDASDENHDDTAAIAGLESGGLDMVVLVGKWIEGLDVPCISCVVLMCLTASIQKFLQMLGRGFRPHESKDLLYIVDLFGNAGRVVNCQFIPKHGMPDWNRVWELMGRKVGRSGPKPDDPKPLMVCPVCFITHEPAPQCACGYVYTSEQRKPPKKLKGEMVKLTPEQREQQKQEKAAAKAEQERQRALQRSAEKREEWQAESLDDFKRIARSRGYAETWAHIRWKIKEPQIRARAESAARRHMRNIDR